MMKKSNQKKWTVAKLLFVAPIIVFAVYFVSCSKSEQLLVDHNELMKTGKNNQTEIKEQLTIIDDSSLAKEENKKNAGTSGEIYESFAIDERPDFPGGMEELISYVAKNTVYPAQAIKDSIQGTIYVRFVVTKTGEIGETSIMKPVDPLLEAEATRVVKSLPKWTPGMNNGQPVNVWFIMPVKFKLN